MEVKPGYKETEVGMIPRDWDVLPLAHLGRFSKGQGIRKNEAASGTIPCVRYGEIYTHHNDIIHTYKSHISPAVAATSRLLNKGDILFAGSGETKEEIGKAVAFVDDIVAFAGSDIVILSPNSACSEFLGYVLNSTVVARQKASKGQGDAVVHISATALGAICTPLPPIPEQRAIATALSDVDALLAGLDRLIAKKRDLKQAVMQQLLTGKTRLSGFFGEWQKKPLGELGATYGGLTGKTKADFGVGTSKYITFMNVIANTVIDCTACEQVNVSASETQNRVMRGDLLFNGSSETPQEVAFCSLMAEDVPDLYLNSFCFGFRLFDDQQVDGLFLTYYIRANPGREMMKSLVQGSTRYNLSKKALCEATVLLPLREEQAAIAEVLSGMDAELIALERRLDKTRNIKQAMMQELLTGKTRLV